MGGARWERGSLASGTGFSTRHRQAERIIVTTTNASAEKEHSSTYDEFLFASASLNTMSLVTVQDPVLMQRAENVVQKPLRTTV